MASERDFGAIVLAAGLGKRMKSPLPKVLAKLGEKPLILRTLNELYKLNPQKIVIVIGYQGALVQEEVKKWQRQVCPNLEILFANQPEQKGTGDAVLAAKNALSGFQGNLLIIPGDVPLIKTSSLQEFVKFHFAEKSPLSLV